ncbi:hypothetical protein L3X38_006907 [Prunus dulcis]|uniref:Uncharacterized protein n=1 Tax=Prunus dulcis TaxID=3755 RepID=A0AAD4ZTJ4_PRUDU|nr:hypothetical protein L3X38_006907 [Prunus dulcis]
MASKNGGLCLSDCLIGDEYESHRQMHRRLQIVHARVGVKGRRFGTVELLRKRQQRLICYFEIVDFAGTLKDSFSNRQHIIKLKLVSYVRQTINFEMKEAFGKPVILRKTGYCRRAVDA